MLRSILTFLSLSLAFSWSASGRDLRFSDMNLGYYETTTNVSLVFQEDGVSGEERTNFLGQIFDLKGENFVVFKNSRCTLWGAKVKRHKFKRGEEFFPFEKNCRSTNNIAIVDLHLNNGIDPLPDAWLSCGFHYEGSCSNLRISHINAVLHNAPFKLIYDN